MEFVFITEDYNSPELLEQDEMDRDMKFLKENIAELTRCLALYDKEMLQDVE